MKRGQKRNKCLDLLAATIFRQRSAPLTKDAHFRLRQIQHEKLVSMVDRSCADAPNKAIIKQVNLTSIHSMLCKSPNLLLRSRDGSFPVTMQCMILYSTTTEAYTSFASFRTRVRLHPAPRPVMPSRLCNLRPLNLRIERSPSTEKHNDRAITPSYEHAHRRAVDRGLARRYRRSFERYRLIQPPDLNSTAEADAVSLLANRRGRESGEKHTTRTRIETERGTILRGVVPQRSRGRESEIATRSPPRRSRAAPEQRPVTPPTPAAPPPPRAVPRQRYD